MAGVTFPVTHGLYGLYAARQENQENRSSEFWESANLHSALKMWSVLYAMLALLGARLWVCN